MKKFLALFLGLAFMLTMIITEDASAQTRRKRYRGLATNAAIVGGGTAAGALVGGRKGAAMGAGAGLLYASSRRGSKRTAYDSKYRRAAKVGGGTLLGAGLGAALGGKKGAILGGLAGAGGTYVYTRKRRPRN